ncbi:MAG: O-antigen ligase family protein, partial [Planctomycetes bacterium]|nr:O-antigen ligase family protein [Planctomycetota bacterium]
LFLVEKGRRRILAILAACIFIGVVFSYARSAWLALAFMAGLLAFIKGRRFVIATALVGSIMVTVILALSPSVRDRLATTFMAKKNLERIYLWKTSADMALDHPLTGIGPGAYRKVVREYRRDYNIKWTTESHAHNSIIMAAAESGFVGMLLLMLMMVAVFYDPVRSVFASDVNVDDIDLLRALLSAMAGFAFACMFQHNFGDAEVVMTFWFIAVAANDFSSRDDLSAPSNPNRNGK